MASAVRPVVRVPSAALAPPARPDPVRTVLRLAMVATVYALPLLVALWPAFDWDVWWHLAVGRWIVEHGTLPTLDPFTQAHQPWVAYSWLFEVTLYGLYAALGLWGIVVYRVVMALAVTAAIHRLVARREAHFLTAIGLTGLATLAVAMLFKERPWLVTVLFTTLTLDVVLDVRAGRRSCLLWILPLCFVVWANVHIQFVYGLLVLTLGCVAPFLDRMLGWEAEGDGGWRTLVVLLAACLFATLVNPFGLGLYAVVVEYATQPGPFNCINELMALQFREPCDWVMLGLFGAAAFALGRRVRLSSFDVLLLAAAAYLSFRMRRDLWVVTIASLAILATSRRKQVVVDDRFPMPLHRVAIVGLLLLGVSFATIRARGLSDELFRAKVEERFPVQAAAAIRERGVAGPLFNDFNWGGYLIWALPELPVAIDGRTNLHGDERIYRFGNTWAGVPGWASDPDLTAANVVLADATSPLAGLLVHDERFERVHADPVAVVFVRRMNPLARP